MDALKNFAKAVVSGNYDGTVTEIDLETGHGARLPAAPFNATWWNATDFPDPSDDPGVEIVRVTAVSTDTLTITRAQEGTAAADHNVAGKTYVLTAPLTVAVIRQMVGDASGSGTALVVSADDDTIRLRVSPAVFILVSSLGMQIQSSEGLGLGDVEGEGNFTSININDTTQLLNMSGKIGTNQTADASVSVGTLVKKLPIYDPDGTLLGYIPIYSSIT